MIRSNISLFLLTIAACLGFSFIAIKVSNFSTDNTEIANLEKPNPSDRHLTNTISDNSIRVALILDTSSSMSGLIEQAKSQLWNILNELARTEKNDQETELQIALYEYGNPQKATSENQIHQLSGFTDDMDLISEQLFALTTNGGDEYCGAVIKKSLSDLDWGSGQGLKMIYIAGNEGFNQGPIDYRDVCKIASARGIVVNTIFCGDQDAGIAGSWNSGASLGGGDFVSISQNEVTAYITTPFDDEIERLNNKLNKTYIPYGSSGNKKKNNQLRQDMNAMSYSKSNAADRISYKSSKKYKADDWDLVDAYKKDKSVLKNADIKEEKYASMSMEELEASIEAATKEREMIQSGIKELSQKRRAYKKSESAKNISDKEKSLQQSIIKTVRKQAAKKDFKIKN